MAGTKGRAFTDFQPGVKQIAGFPIYFKLSQEGTLAAASTTAIDSYTPASSSVAGPAGVVQRITDLHFHLDTTGTGTGATRIQVCVNGTGTVIADVSIASAATAPALVDVVLQDPKKPHLGYPLKAGDVVGLYINTIPGSTASTGLTVHCSGGGHGVYN